jgi:hypothetical protein
MTVMFAASEHEANNASPVPPRREFLFRLKCSLEVFHCECGRMDFRFDVVSLSPAESILHYFPVQTLNSRLQALNMFSNGDFHPASPASSVAAIPIVQPNDLSFCSQMREFLVEDTVYQAWYIVLVKRH